MSQTTIHRSVRCTGIGLHSGKQVDMVLRPAAEDTGILFALRDGSGSTFLTPAPSLVVETSLATVLGDGRETVATVEHLLATINGMGIDNIHIEVSGKEVPIMDGSAASFVYLLKQAGVRRLSKPRKVMAIKKALDFEQDGKYIKARPYDGLRLDYTIEFAHPRIGRQHLSMEITPENFSQHLAKARTFGFLKEVDYLHANGLALGGSLDNAVVLDEYNILNAEGLRFEDEFVRHKMLDFVGDIATFGARLQGSFEVFASGHALNNAFLRHLDENRDLYLEERVQSAPVAKEAPSRERLQPVPAMA
ncbi:UDP-3-O-acyl-N-acetylglucosamine deacetylase [Desulfovibrio sp. Fe33]|uniref:UDP-3-O-acyl-N-acetylglucosamine deacetylase n=1 Tax=Desulfovibrio sp. Fe33 TaxID=3020842 RepID=UPI00234CC917|nr:UDP-3-O-acyl-N-acetylglucosamine deacetylase [Desulfovibrio sp. Fe33]